MLEQIRMEHAEDLASLVDHNRAYLKKFLPWLDLSKTIDDSRFFINKCQENFQKDGAPNFAVLYRDQLVGMNGFHPIDTINRNGSIGYWIGENYQSQGITTATTKAVINYGFTTMDLHRLEIRCAVDNVASERIAQKLGFKFEGVKRQVEWLYDQFIDNKVYSLLKKEFSN